MDTWAVVYNPQAGSFSEKRLEDILRAMRAEGVRGREMASRGTGQLGEMVRSLRGVQRVAVLGGDGSLNEAANALLGSRLPLVCLPGGTANVLAAELGMPFNAKDLVQQAVRSPAVELHPGMLNHRAFLLMAGLGYDARLVRRVEGSLKRRLGKSAYVLSGLRELLRPQPIFDWRLPGVPGVPGKQGLQGQAVWLVACRAGCYGGKFVVLHPEAALLADQLGFVAAPPGRLTGLLLERLVFKRRGRGLMGKWAMGDNCQVSSPIPLHAQVDGEWLSAACQFHIALHPKTIWLVMPQAAP